MYHKHYKILPLKHFCFQEKFEYKNLLVLPVNFDKFQIAAYTAVQWYM